MRSINTTQFYRHVCKFYRLCLSFSVFSFFFLYNLSVQLEYQNNKTLVSELFHSPTIRWLHFCGKNSSLPHRAHRWCPQRYMGRAKRALIKGFDQKKTHHLPSSPPFCTQRIHGQKDAGQVPYKNGRFAMNNWRKDLKQREQKVWA